MPWEDRDVVTSHLPCGNALHGRCLPAQGCPSGLLRRITAMSWLQTSGFLQPAVSA
jgi:hypothetical protein